MSCLGADEAPKAYFIINENKGERVNKGVKRNATQSEPSALPACERRSFLPQAEFSLGAEKSRLWI